MYFRSPTLLSILTISALILNFSQTFAQTPASHIELQSAAVIKQLATLLRAQTTPNYGEVLGLIQTLAGDYDASKPVGEQYGWTEWTIFGIPKTFDGEDYNYELAVDVHALLEKTPHAGYSPEDLAKAFLLRPCGTYESSCNEAYNQILEQIKRPDSDLTRVRALVNRFPDIASYKTRDTPSLIASIQAKNLEVARILVNPQFTSATPPYKITEIFNEFSRVLLQSISTGFIPMIELLIKQGFIVKNDELNAAIQLGSAEILKTLIQGDVILSQMDTPLGEAAITGRTDLIEILMQVPSSDVNTNYIYSGPISDVGNVPPIFLAATYGHLDAVKLLVKLGADINFISIINHSVYYGANALGVAEAYQNCQVAEYLRSLGLVSHLPAFQISRCKE